MMYKKKRSVVKKASVYTIGHSTRSVEEFIKILKRYDINQVIDIRTIPRSRHNPQFNFDVLPKKLRAARIGYRHMKGLGGLRHAQANSINTAWQNASFRGFADYMQTTEFKKNIEKLLIYAKKKRMVIMCAEAVPWRCHRSLIGDALLIRHVEVIDIYSATSAKRHVLTDWAHVDGTTITYPK